MSRTKGFTIFSDLTCPAPAAWSGKSALAALATLISAVFLAACAADNASSGTSAAPGGRSSTRSGDITLGNDGLSGLDLGDDWERSMASPAGRRGTGPAAAATPTPTGAAPVTLAAAAPAGEWAIVLFTFTGLNHANEAVSAAARLRTIGPDFATVRSHTDDKGSMVLFGVYTSGDDPAAQTDLARLRAVPGRDGRRLFPRVMLSYIEPPQAVISPLDLRSVRRTYGPDRVIYTLDIAVWIAPDDSKVRYTDLRAQAEAYARQLRQRGFEAYFYHNERAQISSVTIGMFGQGAVDPQSGILSPEVQALARDFPARLNNGQPLLLPIDRFRPERGTRPQGPILVEVPE